MTHARHPMLTNPSTLSEFLRANHLKPTKQFGQNFLVNEKVLTRIIDAAELKQTDHVIEIGAGVGTLTRALAEKAGNVTALEYDRNLIPALEQNLAGCQNVALLNLDVRRFTPPETPYKLVANIPYYLTSPILRQFFVETMNRPSVAVLLVQKEVAEKICDERLSVLALEVRIFGTPEIIMRVPRESFLPPPKVESAVLKIQLKNQPEIVATDLPEFFSLLHAGFRAPRKKIGGSLGAGWPHAKEVTKKILTNAGINLELRPAELTIADWKNILVEQRNTLREE